MTEQFDSFGEKAKKIDKAMKYTNNDIDKAKAMVSGQYQDIIVVKSKFIVYNKDQSGIILAFFNTIDEYIANIDTIIFTTPDYFTKGRVFDDWKTLYGDFPHFKEDKDVIESQDFTEFLLDSFISMDVFPEVIEKNLETLTGQVIEILSKAVNDKNVQCQIELEQTSSLDMELTGINLDVPGQEEQTASSQEDENPYASQINSIESEADYIIKGNVIVAPVKGKYINDIIVGDKIKVSLTGKDVVSIKILKVLNCIDNEGNRKAVKGRVKAKIPLDKSGYLIYALIAKGVIAKIIEEENVKICLDILEEQDNITTKMDNRLFIYIIILLVLILISGFILSQLL